jgi:hypothetical protein
MQHVLWSPKLSEVIARIKMNPSEGYGNMNHPEISTKEQQALEATFSKKQQANIIGEAPEYWK